MVRSRNVFIQCGQKRALGLEADSSRSRQLKDERGRDRRFKSCRSRINFRMGRTDIYESRDWEGNGRNEQIALWVAVRIATRDEARSIETWREALECCQSMGRKSCIIREETGNILSLAPSSPAILWMKTGIPLLMFQTSPVYPTNRLGRIFGRRNQVVAPRPLVLCMTFDHDLVA